MYIRLSLGLGWLKRWGKPGWVEGTGGIQNYRAPVNKQPLREVPFDSPHDTGCMGYLFMKRRREGQVSGVDTYSDPGLLRVSLPRVEGLKPVGFRCPGVSWGQIAKQPAKPNLDTPSHDATNCRHTPRVGVSETRKMDTCI